MRVLPVRVESWMSSAQAQQTKAKHSSRKETELGEIGVIGLALNPASPTLFNNRQGLGIALAQAAQDWQNNPMGSNAHKVIFHEFQNHCNSL